MPLKLNKNIKLGALFLTCCLMQTTWSESFSVEKCLKA